MKEVQNFLIAAILTILSIYPTLGISKEGDLYDFLWLDPDKKVYVLQNKLHKKKGTTYIDLGIGSNQTAKYQDTTVYHFNIGHYIKEEWAFELFYKQYSHSNNETYTNVLQINGGEPFIRRINQSYGALLVWSPFYGKINTFNQIFYFDWSFGLGPALIKADSNKETVLNPALAGQYKDESYVGIHMKTQFKFHLNKNWHIGLELNNTNFQAQGPTDSNKKIKSWSDAMISFGFSF